MWALARGVRLVRTGADREGDYFAQLAGRVMPLEKAVAVVQRAFPDSMTDNGRPLAATVSAALGLNYRGGGGAPHATNAQLRDVLERGLRGGQLRVVFDPVPPAVPIEHVPETAVPLKAPPLRAGLYVGVELSPLDKQAPGHAFQYAGITIDIVEGWEWTRPEGDKKGSYTWAVGELAPGKYEVRLELTDAQRPFYSTPEPQKVDCPAGALGRASFVVKPNWIGVRLVEVEARDKTKEKAPFFGAQVFALLPEAAADRSGTRDSTTATDATGTTIIGAYVEGAVKLVGMELPWPTTKSAAGNDVVEEVAWEFVEKV